MNLDYFFKEFARVYDNTPTKFFPSVLGISAPRHCVFKGAHLMQKQTCRTEKGGFMTLLPNNGKNSKVSLFINIGSNPLDIIFVQSQHSAFLIVQLFIDKLLDALTVSGNSVLTQLRAVCSFGFSQS